MGNGALASGPKLPRPSSTLPAVSGGQGREAAYPLQRRGDRGHTRILLPLRHSRCVYAGAVIEDGEHSPRLVRTAAPVANRSITPQSATRRNGPIATKSCAP